ncbi:Formylglycine-generating enzyme, required for sulfatase activity, contains SUMF1/FGE domain [Neorhodopirellula lusitana]|uniref:Formylglycine-generating enzyme, required for sulfatase activity, contains SUMF1/FGE domain n=1 Tax=Neorhodopirellula lusitana TaxID=445327 RepID=A0ABY1Q9C1_9BACT|nr:formylglycine-generating enzyme family protein [Neorhodopirellula lusitana]SMP63896.1 Formylglycine-generating enzyme, required for sulfatase activity, contains SUMF1/FGE domain [Neorhodopirellula lusitana]
MKLFSRIAAIGQMLLQVGCGTGSSASSIPVDCPDMVLIKAGTFVMGSPETEPGRGPNEPQKRVTIDADFYMGKYEITVGQFRYFCQQSKFQTDNEKKGDDYNWKRPYKKAKPTADQAVLSISWDDANAYCQWLSRVTGDRYRLPTEREWEYACRAGTTTAFHTGGQLTKADANFSNYIGSTEGLAAISAVSLGTKVVGSYSPNAFGLYDMHGNAFEWCADVFTDERKSETRSGKYHTVKGGSWSMTSTDYCRSAHREGMDGGNGMMGFRVVREVQ